MITLTPATPGEWGAAMANAREFLDAAQKLIGAGSELCLQKGTLIYEMHEALCPRASALVQLGKLLGAPVQSITIRTEDAA